MSQDDHRLFLSSHTVQMKHWRCLYRSCSARIYVYTVWYVPWVVWMLEMQEAYKAALEIIPEKSQEQIATYHANLAQAYIMQENWQMAAKSATHCLKMRPGRAIKIKALKRRAQSYESLKDISRAYADFQEVHCTVLIVANSTSISFTLLPCIDIVAKDKCMVTLLPTFLCFAELLHCCSINILLMVHQRWSQLGKPMHLETKTFGFQTHVVLCIELHCR